MSSTRRWGRRSPGLLQRAKSQASFSDGTCSPTAFRATQSELPVQSCSRQQKRESSTSLTPRCRHERNKVSRRRKTIFTLCIQDWYGRVILILKRLMKNQGGKRTTKITREMCFSRRDGGFRLFSLSTREVRGDLIAAYKSFPGQKILGRRHFSQIAEKDNNRIQWLKAGARQIQLEIRQLYNDGGNCSL